MLFKSASLQQNNIKKFKEITIYIVNNHDEVVVVKNWRNQDQPLAYIKGEDVVLISKDGVYNNN
ncbi:MAG: hypothetical protein SOZ89_03355 [Peptoniphilaceae bacterium]|nr:hypothetical protein [Peptoniphilaceae bacterium]MDD7383854.1 hypothetical protein [Peptoniphilaceae bacterium]MDY3738143.1 hypothetical protein [Peptoniphilaceae bacterium]